MFDGGLEDIYGGKELFVDGLEDIYGDKDVLDVRGYDDGLKVGLLLVGEEEYDGE